MELSCALIPDTRLIMDSVDLRYSIDSDLLLTHYEAGLAPRVFEWQGPIKQACLGDSVTYVSVSYP